MKERTMKRALIAASCLAVCLAIAAPTARAESAGIKPVTVGEVMPDFTLPVSQGGLLTLSSLRGRNVMIIFPRGYAAEDHWCTIDDYCYIELAELERTKNIRKKYDLEILVVFPYGAVTVRSWLDALPGLMDNIIAVKNPADPAKLDEAGRKRMERFRAFFPADYKVAVGKVPTPFPILIDGERAVSKGLGLFMTEWGGGKAEQNIPSVYIVDKKGVLRFKYIGQSTVDRPGSGYLLRIIDEVNEGAFK